MQMFELEGQTMKIKDVYFPTEDVNCFSCALQKGYFLTEMRRVHRGFALWNDWFAGAVLTMTGFFSIKRQALRKRWRSYSKETGPVAYTSVLYLCGQSDTVVFFPGELHQVTFLCRNSNMLWTIIDNANCSQKSIPLGMPLYVRRTKLRKRNSTFAITSSSGGGGGRILRITWFSRGAKWDQSSPTEYKGVTIDWRNKFIKLIASEGWGSQEYRRALWV